MPWTALQVESFPHVKLQQALLNRRTAHKANQLNTSQICQNAILGWQCIAPHTPPESDISSHNFPPDSILMLVINLLSQTEEISGLNDPAVVPHIKQLMDIWPTVWIWIRLFYAWVDLHKDALPKARLDKERHRYITTIQALLFFLGYNKEREAFLNELTTLVKETDGVLAMIATSWIEEAKDQHAFLGFPASGIHLITNDEIISEFEQRVLAKCNGSKSEMASLALHRIAHSLRRTRFKTLYYHLVIDMAYVHAMMGDPSTTLHHAFKTHPGYVALFVDVMLCLLSAPHLAHMPVYFGLVTSAMNLMVMNIDNFPSYAEFRELLDHTRFWEVITRGALAARSAHDTWPILSRIGQDYAGISAFIGNQATPATTSLLDLRSQIIPFVAVYKAFKKSSPTIFCCGNRECDFNDKEGTLHRCSGCKLVLYCSNNCQKQDWRGVHKDFCNAMSRQIQALFPMSSPDLRWLAHLIKNNFLQMPLPSSTGEDCFYTINYCSLEQPEGRLIDIVDEGLLQPIPHGSDNAWRDISRSRKSGHDGIQPTQTVLIQVLLPQGKDARACATALLTYPERSVIPPNDAANKYKIDGMENFLRKDLASPRFLDTDPARVFGVACFLHLMKRPSKLAATATSAVDIEELRADARCRSSSPSRVTPGLWNGDS
ncbi:hypothetical protein FIBSPDRAFT_1042235, partial [Athelia psychrophila]